MHFLISELKHTIIKILYTYRQNAFAKYWNLKMKEDEKVPKKKYTIFSIEEYR